MPEFQLFCPACQVIHVLRHPVLSSVSQFIRLRLLCPTCGVELTVNPENVIFIGVTQQPITPNSRMFFDPAERN